MEHDERSVLKDISGQANMNPLQARDFNPVHKKPLGFMKQDDRRLCEDSDSSSSDDYRSAEEEDEAFNKELDSVIRGMSSVQLMTPKGKKLKARLQRSFSLNKSIDLNLSQQLVKEIENANVLVKDKENRCTEISHNTSVVENEEDFQSLLDQSDYESPVNTTIKLAKTPSKQKLADTLSIDNQPITNALKNQSEDGSNISSVPENTKIDINVLNEQIMKKEEICEPKEEIANQTISTESVNKSEDLENIDKSQIKEITSVLKVNEFIASTLENIPQNESIKPIEGSAIVSHEEIIKDEKIQEQEHINESPVPSISNKEVKPDDILSENVTNPTLNTTFDNNIVQIHKNNPETGPDPNLTLENSICDSKTLSASTKLNEEKKLFDNFPEKSTKPILDTTFENIVQDPKIILPSLKPDGITIDKNLLETQPIVNKTFDNSEPNCEIVPVSQNQEDLKIKDNFSESKTPSNIVFENVTQACEPIKSDTAVEVDNLSEQSAQSNKSKTEFTPNITYDEDHFADVPNRNDELFKLPNIPPENLQIFDSLNKTVDLEPKSTETFVYEPNQLSEDPSLNESITGNFLDSSQIVEKKSDLNQTAVISDIANSNLAGNITINKLHNPTIIETNIFQSAISHKEPNYQPEVLSNLDQTVTFSDVETECYESKISEQNLKIDNSIAITGRLSDIFKSDLAMNKFANSTFAEENRLDNTVMIEQTDINNDTITETKAKNEPNMIPNLNETVMENVQPETKLCMNTTITYSPELKPKKDVNCALNETYDFRDPKSKNSNHSDSLDKPEEFELTKMINTPASLDQTVIINNFVSYNDIGSNKKMDNKNNASEKLNLLDTTNNFHKVPNDFTDFELATKTNLQSTIIGNPDQDTKTNTIKDNNEFYDSFNVNQTQIIQPKCNLSKNSLKIFDEFDSKSFSNEDLNVDLLCQTLDGINLNNTHMIDVKMDQPAKKNEDLMQQKGSLLDESVKQVKDKCLFEDSLMKFDESNSNIPKVVITNEKDPKNSNVSEGLLSANSLLLGSPLNQNKTSEKQNVDRPESPKSTSSIFKWIGQLLSPGKFSSGAQTDNTKQPTDEQNNVKCTSNIQTKSSKNISKFENDFVSLGDETPLPDFMSVSTTSEPFNESRVNNEEQIEFLNELIQLRQLVNQNANKIKETKQQIEDYHNKNDKIQKSIEAYDKTLQQKIENERVLGITFNNFEKRVKELAIENEIAVRENTAKLQKFKEDRDSATNHLSSVESAFSDLHKKYEQCKTVIEEMKKQQEILKTTNNNLRDITLEQKIALETLDDHAANQIKTAQADLESRKHQFEIEQVKRDAMRKKAELAQASLEQALAKKRQENRELIELCDSLIQQVK